MATIVPPTVSTNSALLKGVSANPGAGGATQVPPGILALPAGTVLRGDIIKIDGRGNAVLHTAKGDVSLQTDLPIKLGSEITLRLTISSDAVRARILSINGMTPQEFSEKSAQPRGQNTQVDDIVQTGKQNTAAKPEAAASQARGTQTGTAATAGTAPATDVKLPADAFALRGVLLSRAANLPQVLQALPSSIALPIQRLEAGAIITVKLVQNSIQLPQSQTATATPSTATPTTATSGPPAATPATPTATTTPATAGATAATTPAGTTATTPTASPAAAANTATPTPTTATTQTASPTPQTAAPTATTTPAATTGTPTTPAQPGATATTPTTPNTAAPAPTTTPGTTTPTATTTPSPATTPTAQTPTAPTSTTATPSPQATAASTPPQAAAATTATTQPTAPTAQPAPPAGTATAAPNTNTATPATTTPTTAPPSTTAAAAPPAPAATSPAPSPPAQLAQGLLPAQVIGHEQSGETVVKTALGTLKVSIPSPSGPSTNLPIGTQFNLQIQSINVPVQNLATQIAAQISTAPAPLSELSMNWHSLQETVQILAQTQPAAAAQVLESIIPKPGAKMAAATLFFLSALRGGDIRQWLGDRTLEILEQNQRGDLVRKLTSEFSTLRQFFTDSPSPNWQAAFVPVHDGENWQQARMFLKKEPQGGAEGEAGGTRFIMEVDLSQMGPMQFDGLVRKRAEAVNFDLIIRSRDTLSESDRQNIRDIYQGSSELTGFKGGISFQVTNPFPVLPMQEILSDAPDVMA